jgi:hypothetical protein
VDSSSFKSMFSSRFHPLKLSPLDFIRCSPLLSTLAVVTLSSRIPSAVTSSSFRFHLHPL